MEKETQNVDASAIKSLTPEQVEEINLLLTNSRSSRQCVIDDFMKSETLPSFIKQSCMNLVNSYVGVESSCLFILNEFNHE